MPTDTRARGEGLQVKAEDLGPDEAPSAAPMADRRRLAWVNQRLKIDSRKWLVSKLLPKEYGDRIDMNHSGGISVQVVTGVPDG